MFVPKNGDNDRRGILGTLGRLALLSRQYNPNLRGVTVLGNGLRRLNRNTSDSNSANVDRDRGFGKFSKIGDGNIATSSNMSMGKMDNPAKRDKNALRKWS